jgi:peptidoglycan/LPS O-acetylase OafA/YrhL
VSAEHVPALDGIRGVAILAVLVHHFRFILEPIHRSQRITLWWSDGGWCGVELFFVLSGYLITGILLDSKGKFGYFRAFYARRILRIFPLYYAYLIFVFVGLRFWWETHFNRNPWMGLNPAWYFSYLENFKPRHMFGDLFLGHLWSLCVEEQFYLVWPFLIFVLNRFSLTVVCVVGMIASLVCRLLLAGIDVQTSFYLNTLTLASLDSLCAGALVALLVRRRDLSRPTRMLIIAIGLADSLAFALVAARAGTLFLYTRIIHTWGVTLLAIGFACLVYLVTTSGGGWIARILSIAPLRAVGRVSYGMYVLHPVVVAFVLPHVRPITPGTPPFTQFVVKVAVMILLSGCSYLAAVVSWIVLEQPILRFKRRFRYGTPLQPSADVPLPVGSDPLR